MPKKSNMKNPYLSFAATVLLLNVATIVFTGIVIMRHFPFIHIINATISIVIAFVLLTVKWRWKPIVGIFYGLIFTILTVPSFIISMFQNIDPEYNAMREASNPFIGISLLSALYVLTVLVCSIAGLIVTIRRESSPIQPGTWFTKMKYAFYGIFGMGILISGYLQIHWITGVNADTLDELPTIVMKSDYVEPATLEVRAGQPIALLARNESENQCHILSFPELDASVHMEQGRAGIIVIDPQPGTYTYGCKPHHDFFNSDIKGTLIVHP